MLHALKDVYRNDELARQDELSPEERLKFHQTHSKPVMEDLQKWLQRQFAERLVEPNSALGGAGLEEGDLAPQEFAVLQDRERSRHRRPVHQPDPHVRTGWVQPPRLLPAVGTSPGRTDPQPGGVPWRSGHPPPRRPSLPIARATIPSHTLWSFVGFCTLAERTLLLRLIAICHASVIGGCRKSRRSASTASPVDATFALAPTAYVLAQLNPVPFAACVVFWPSRERFFIRRLLSLVLFFTMGRRVRKPSQGEKPNPGPWDQSQPA